MSKIACLLLMCSLSSFAFAQETHSKYIASDYPDSAFSTTKHDYRLDSITIRIIQISTNYLKQNHDRFYCRAWIQVIRKTTILKQVFLHDIDPVGGNYGLFVPKIQPIPSHFILIKLGDYDGRMYIIDNNGSLDDFPGGEFVVSKDRKYLITEHDTDGNDTITVVSVDSGKKLFSTKIIRPIYNWYQSGENIFYRPIIEPPYPAVAFEDKDTICVLDINAKRLQLLNRSPFVKIVTKLSYYMDLKKLNNCSCDD